MRELFKEYYRPTDEEFARLWQEATFVFDTNVLLHFYRYTASTRDDLLHIIESLQQRVWLPHQVGLEFSRNRVGVIAEQNAIFTLIKALETFVEEKFIRDIVQKYGKRGHFFADLDKIQAIFKQTKQALQDELQNARDQSPDPMEDDILLERLDELFQGKIGTPYSTEEMAALSSEFEDRYKRYVPPGFKDGNKKPVSQEDGTKKSTQQQNDPNNPANKYGDVLIWYQIIEYAKREKRPIIFVVDDGKEDWWQQIHGKTVGPRPELRLEIQQKADVSFYMYTVDNFIQKAQQFLQLQVQEETIKEVRENSIQEAKQREDLINTYPSESLFPSSVLYPSATDMSTLNNFAITLAQATENISGISEFSRWALEQKQSNERLLSSVAVLKDKVNQAVVYKDDRFGQAVVYKDDISDGYNL